MPDLYCENCGLLEFFAKDADGEDIKPWPQRCDDVLVETPTEVAHEVWCDLCLVAVGRRGITELNGRRAFGTRFQRGSLIKRVRFLDEDLSE